ncbi:MAG: hypothetical protein II208_01940, partial [Alphaproteobacteria bacterium]|nr:hypothetical protein [Alphaproteobacteria bacterium]
VDGINNNDIKILDAPTADNAHTISCEEVIKKLGGVYNVRSLSQYLICQYVYWQNLEKRINIKQCLMAGRSDCN